MRFLLRAVGLLGSSMLCAAPLLAEAREEVSPAVLEAAKRAGRVVDGLPEYTRAQVALHKDPQSSVWVIYQNAVYDVTEFVAAHPGGTKLLLGAGSSIDKYWAMYAVHQTPETKAILEQYRIGNVHRSERLSDAELEMQSDIWANEPKRDPRLVVRTARPCNAESPAEDLAASFITPTPIFYVRHHLPVPMVDMEAYQLEVHVPGRDEPLLLSLEDIKSKFPKHEVAVTVQCAGNRRTAMGSVRPVRGLSWGTNAIGTAVWGGARLSDVLHYAGLQADTPGVKHVQFEGLDRDMESSYGASVPVHKALSSDGDVLLAYEMNGAELPRDHGAPLRVIVPGTVGARHVKWVFRIVASDEESPSFWQRKDYRMLPPWELTPDRTPQAPPIQEMPVQSAILVPQHEQVLPVGTAEIAMRGYAYSGGGRGIVRVDVSVDGGHSWHCADLDQAGTSQLPGKAWAWTPFRATVRLPRPLAAGQRVELVCRAVDSSFNTQPEKSDDIWNVRGLLNNAWHRVTVIGGQQ